MGDVSQNLARSRWFWIAAIFIIVVVNVLLLGAQTGQCVDFTAESGLESSCSVGPVIGVPAMWLVAVASLIAVAYCVYRFIRRSRGG